MEASSAMVAVLGGVLIGAGAALLLLLNGRLGAVGGIVAGLLPPSRGDRAWRLAFAAGLFGGGVLLAWLRPGALGASPAGLPALAMAGVAVGFGARLGGGCTSGHGICGISRRSRRALVATLIFMGTAATIVALQRLLAGVS